MDIKLKLKEMDIKLGDFASNLEISRPTLNSYISTFENNESIQSEKHQIIFEKLFNENIESKEKFNDVLKKYRYLIERDKALGTLEYDAKKTDVLTSIFERMKDDLNEDGYDEDVYTFINMLIRSYKDVHVFKKFARYFLYLNGVIELDKMKDEDKPFVSNFYKISLMDKFNKLQIDDDYFSKFIERVKEIKLINEQKSVEKMDVIKQCLEDTINQKIKEQLKLGLDVDEIDIEKVLENLGIKKSSNN